jgi:hypothetical protein
LIAPPCGKNSDSFADQDFERRNAPEIRSIVDSGAAFPAR